MSVGRLLIDIEVLEFLRTLRQSEQRALLRRFREIGASPDRYADYPERIHSGQFHGAVKVAATDANDRRESHGRGS